MKNREEKFLRALKRGLTVTRKQAQTRYALKNPSAAVYRFEDRGYDVQRQYKLNKKTGARTVKYSF